jgi:hypothetical protein
VIRFLTNCDDVKRLGASVATIILIIVRCAGNDTEGIWLLYTPYYTVSVGTRVLLLDLDHVWTVHDNHNLFHGGFCIGGI